MEQVEDVEKKSIPLRESVVIFDSAKPSTTCRCSLGLMFLSSSMISNFSAKRKRSSPGRNSRPPSNRPIACAIRPLLASGCNLDRKNPRTKEDITHLPPERLAESILAKDRRIAEILGSVKTLLTKTK